MRGKKIILTVMILFALILSLNLLFPFMSDDYTFLYVWRGDYGSMFSGRIDYPLERIENLSDVLTSLHSLYLTWGGRMVTWSLAYFFANMPTLLFDVVNSFAYMALIVLITMLGTGKFSLRELSAKWLTLTFFLLFGASAMFCEAYLWLAGSVGYLWTALAQLLFLFFYVRFYKNRGVNRGALPHTPAGSVAPCTPVIFVVGLLAGQTNENAGALTILLAVGLCCKFKRNGILAAWHVWGVVGAVVGYLVLMLAPGNFVRMAVGSAVNFPLLMADLPRQKMRIITALLSCVPLLLVYLRLPKLTGDDEQRSNGFLADLFLAAGIINTVIMFPLLHFPLRSLTGSVIFWLIGALIVLGTDKSFCKLGTVRRLGGAYLLITVFSWFAFTYALAAYFTPQEKAMVEAARNNMGAELVLPPYHAPSGVAGLASLKDYRGDCGSIGKDTAAWPNRVFAKYWQLQSVKREVYFVAE